MTITAQKYTFHLQFETEAKLPGYLGSTLRGSLGWALKKTSCALRRQQCGDCLLREQCAYAWLFETERYKNGTGTQVNARPHPFVLNPDEEVAGGKLAGDGLSFSLCLLDRANKLLPQIVYAVQMMGESGIGSGRRYGLGKFSVIQLVSEEKILYLSDDGLLYHQENIEKIYLDSSLDQDVDSISIHLRTPLRLKTKNTLQHDLPFHVLIRACLRRIAALENAYGQGEPELDYRGLVEKAAQVQMTESNINWKELFRYSNRQRKKVSLSGLAGSAVYEGELGEFMPILRYCEQLNIGKQTVFGLGNFTLDSSCPAP